MIENIVISDISSTYLTMDFTSSNDNNCVIIISTSDDIIYPIDNEELIEYNHSYKKVMYKDDANSSVVYSGNSTHNTFFNLPSAKKLYIYIFEYINNFEYINTYVEEVYTKGSSESNNRIRFKILDNHTRLPIENCLIQLYNRKGNLIYYGETGSNGILDTDRMPTGGVTTNISHINYVSKIAKTIFIKNSKSSFKSKELNEYLFYLLS